MVFIENSKARFDYEILDKYEAGIELLGFEVKSIRNKHGKIEGAFVVRSGNEAFLLGADIPAYQKKNAPDGYDSTRSRKLLLKKREIHEIFGKHGIKGLTVVPLSMYSKGPKIKLGIATARSKKRHDKRESIKKRETEREIRRTLTT